VEGGICTPDEVIERYEAVRDKVLTAAEGVLDEPRLGTTRRWNRRGAGRAAVASRAGPVGRPPSAGSVRVTLFTAEPRLLEEEGPLTMAWDQPVARRRLRRDLALLARPRRRQEGWRLRSPAASSGLGRPASDTLLDETSILGLALGCGVSGLLPIPEIQYLAYLHNAEDQLRGEAATLPFFSQGQYTNPMVVRVPGYAYQRGFGGHFHNDNALAVLRDIPGLIIASPARPDDAAAMLRTCIATAETAGLPCVYLEPIALYHTRDLYEDGDGGWLAPYLAPPQWVDAHTPVGRARTYGVGGDLTIVTFGNGLRMSLRVARSLAVAHGIGCRVVDLRWLAPLPVEDVLREAMATGRVLIADETRRSGGVSEGVMAALVDATSADRQRTSEDSIIPLSPAASAVLLSEAAIEVAGARLLDL
jgi:2-oxoisovalerate dehydrogenase E1 component